MLRLAFLVRPDGLDVQREFQPINICFPTTSDDAWKSGVRRLFALADAHELAAPLPLRKCCDLASICCRSSRIGLPLVRCECGFSMIAPRSEEALQ